MSNMICLRCGYEYDGYIDNLNRKTHRCPKCHSYDLITQNNYAEIVKAVKIGNPIPLPALDSLIQLFEKAGLRRPIIKSLKVIKGIMEDTKKESIHLRGQKK